MTYAERNNIGLEELLTYSIFVLQQINVYYINEGCRTFEEYKEYRAVKMNLEREGFNYDNKRFILSKL